MITPRLTPENIQRATSSTLREKKILLIAMASVCLAVTLPVLAQTTVPTISTVAGCCEGNGGPGNPGYSGDGGPATSAQLDNPNSVALDSADNLYIADIINCSVRKVTAATGTIGTVAGGGPTRCSFGGDGGLATSAQLNYPEGTALDAAGNLYISDTSNSIVRKVTVATGLITTVAGTPGIAGYSGDGGPATSAELNNPDGVAVDPAGNLYIADPGNMVVRKVAASTGIITTIAGCCETTGGPGTLGYSGDNGPATSAELNAPQGVAVDSAGNLYIADTENMVVREVTASTGVITTFAGNGYGAGQSLGGYSGDGGPATSAELFYPEGVAVDTASNVYIADSQNMAVREVIASTGVINTVAGCCEPNGIFGYLGDGGPATSAYLYVPTGIAVDSAGNFYIADESNVVIREVSVTSGTPTMTTLNTSLSPSTGGQQVTFTAEVSASGGGSPIGTVSFYNGSALIGTIGITAGVSQLNYSALTAGATHSITAKYNGSASYASSTSAVVSQVVNYDTTTTALATSPNPSTSGETVTMTANVTPGNGVAATGSVGFYNGSTLLANVPLSGGVATFNHAFTVGTFSLKASYAGSNYKSSSTSSVVTQTGNLPPSNTTLVSSLNPSIAGASVTFTATVTPTGPPTPTGTVAFSSDGTAIAGCSAVVLGSSGTSTCTTASLPGGTDSITAVYSGDTNYQGSTSAPLSQVVNQMASNTTLVSSLNPSTAGASVTFTAGITPAGPPTPTGTVAFTANGATIAGCAAVTLTASQSAACTTSVLAVGADAMKAMYSGDTNYQASTSAAFSQTVNRATSNTVLTSSANPSQMGQAVTFTASATGYSPTGTVTFSLNGTPLSGCSMVALASGVAQCTASTLPAGTLSIVAAYSGDGNNFGSSSSALSQVVSQATTTTTLASSLNPSTAGASVTFTATVMPAGPPTPSGSLTFTANGTAITGCTAVALSSSRMAACTTTALAAGNNSITAVYSGDANYLTSTSAALSQVVKQLASTTTLASSLNPSSAGSSVTLTATIFPSGPPVPSGTVAFTSNGAAITGCSAATVSSSSLTASCTTTALAGGTDSIKAIYSGDTNYLTSTSAALSQVVNKLATTIALSSSANPSSAAQSVTLTATINPAGPPTPSGTVTFSSNGTTITGCSAVAVTLAQTAACTTTALGLGTDTITATYSGDSNYLTSASPAISQVVSVATTTTVLASNLNPSTGGQSITFTATVSASGGGSPTGNVSFYNGSTVIGTVGIVAGVSNLNYSALTAGSAHSITATYSGSALMSGSTSSAVSQVVNYDTTTTVLATSPNPSNAGESVSMTATVTPGNGVAATGSVGFYSGATLLASANLSGGVATLNHAFAKGSYSLSAKYNGSTLKSASTSSSVTQTVSPSNTALVSSLNPSTAGASVTLTSTVTTPGGSGPAATGTVAFNSNGSAINGCSAVTLTTSQTAACTTSKLATGTDSIIAVYSGDANYLTSSSPALSQVVNQLASATTLGSSLNPSTAGASVTLTAAITSAGPLTPTGTVAFSSNGAIITGCSAVTLTSSQTAACTTNVLAVGADAVKAVYSGDSNYLPSTSATLSQTVNRATSHAVLTSSVNPSQLGQSVVFTAAVTGDSPTGIVVFSFNGTPISSCSAVAIASGVAQCTISSLPIGTASILAAYQGDNNNFGTGSGSPVLSQVVNQATTTTTLASSLNPSTGGQTVMFTATVNAFSGPTPTGTVSFYNGSILIGTINVISGVSQLNYSALTAGSTHSITASYNGSTTNASSTSAVVSQLVNFDTTTTALTAAPNPSASGQTVTMTATVTPGNGVAATGVVSFYSGTTFLANVQLVSGVATYNHAFTSGTYGLSATYAGSSLKNGSTSNMVTQTVN